MAALRGTAGEAANDSYEIDRLLQGASPTRNEIVEAVLATSAQ